MAGLAVALAWGDGWAAAGAGADVGEAGGALWQAASRAAPVVTRPRLRKRRRLSCRGKLCPISERSGPLGVALDGAVDGS
jgi:hypothetical protein